MTLQDIKRINIRDYLAKRGLNPQMDRTGYGMYLSPFRDERTPSFKVDYNQNLWYDFGTGEGGSVLDLVMILERCDFRQAVAKLESSDSFSFHREKPTNSVSSTHPTLKILSVQNLQDSRLIDYLGTKRGINIDIAREYCREVHYVANGKPYFAVGFQSDGGGWELRNEYFKGGTSPKGITTIFNSSETCLVFEGFIDMLSYLTLKNVARPSVDMVVLNSVVNLSKASEFLKRHQTIHCFLDNDEAGKRALQAVLKMGVEVVDQSPFYSQHKDLNAYLVSHKSENKVSESTEKPVPKIEQQDEKPAPKPPQRRMKFEINNRPSGSQYYAKAGEQVCVFVDKNLALRGKSIPMV